MTWKDWVVVALGANEGDPRRNVLRAIERLRALSDHPIKASSLWETTPADCPPGSPRFVNAVVLFLPRAGETPESLLQKLQLIENEFGRRPKQVLNEPRPLDLDIIAFGHETRRAAELVVPHPRARQRRFVLEPLVEVAPDFIWPDGGPTAAVLLAGLPPDPGMRKLGAAE